MAADSPRELFLIDGNSLVYRAFFALPESIATSKGQPTNAIFGFASMLVKIISEYGVKPTLVVWDAGTSGRDEVYEEYKAGRRERPDLLSEQWPYMHPLVDSFGYTNVKVSGYEADDVIATLASRAAADGIDVTVVTGDRDMFQLVEPRIRIMATGRGITDTKIYDRDAVIDRYGIPPERIPDFYGLKGDTSDNIPGVPGIGDKTASQLLQEWGDLDGVLANIDSISGAKRKQNLTEHADDARISKQLATAVRDVEVDVDFDQVFAREPDRSQLRETFREFELRAPLERLEEALGEDGAAPAERVDEVVEVAAREVPLAELGSLEGELVAVAALRPGRGPRRGRDRRARGSRRGARGRGGGRRGGRGARRSRWPRSRRPAAPLRARSTSTRPARAAHRGRLGRRRGARLRGRDAGGVLDGARRAAGRRARLEDDRDGRRRLRGAAARARHDGRRVPDRPRPARATRSTSSRPRPAWARG